MIRNFIEQALNGRNGRGDAEVRIERVDWGDSVASPALAVDPFERLKVELDRARRYERELTIAVLSAAATFTGAGSNGGSARSDPAGHLVPAAGMELPQVVSLLAAAALHEVLRASDVVCYQHAANRLVLCLTEAGEDDARRALERIRSLFRERLGLDVRGGMARFPADGVTLDDLITTAARRASTDGARAFARGDE